MLITRCRVVAIMLSLGLSSYTLPAQDASISTFPSGAKADALKLQTLAQNYLAAFQQSDSNAMMAFWDPGSPYFAVRKKQLETWFASSTSPKLSNIEIEEPLIDETTARLHVTFAWVVKPALENGWPGSVDSRFLECRKEAGTWKIERDSDPEEDFELALAAGRTPWIITMTQMAEAQLGLCLFPSEGDYDGAIRECTEAIHISPYYSSVYNRRYEMFDHRGSVYHTLGQNESAIRDYSEAIRLDPGHAELFFHRANSYFTSGKVNDAIRDYTTAVNLDSDYAEAFLQRSDAYRFKHDYAKSRRDLIEAHNAFFRRGQGLEQTGDQDGARREYSQAIDVESFFLWSNGSKQRGTLRNWDLELVPSSDFAHALALKPKTVDAFVTRGLAYEATGAHDRAIQDFNQAIRLARPPTEDLYMHRGLAHTSKGDYNLAIVDFDHAIALSHGDAAPFNQRGLVFSEKGEYDSAIRDFTEAIRINPADARLWNNRGIAYAARSDYDRAIQDYNQAIHLDPKSALAFNNRGNAFHLRGDYDRAIHDYSEAIRIDPGDVLPVINRGNSYRGTGDYDRALQDYADVIRRNPADVTALNSRATVYQLKGEYDRAILEYTEAIRLNPQDAVAFANRASANRLKGDYAQAILDCTHAADEKPNQDVFWHARTTCGRAYRALNQPAKARSAFEDAIHTIEAMRRDIVGDEEDQQNFLSRSVSPYYEMIDLLLAEKRPGEALGYAERAKGRVLLDVLHNGRVKSSRAMTDVEQEREKQLENEIASLNSQIVLEKRQDQPDARRLSALQARLQAVRFDFETFQASLYAAHPELKTQRGEVQPVTLPEAFRILPNSHTAVLEFVTEEDRSYLFLATQERKQSQLEPLLNVFPLEIKATELAQKTARYRSQLGQRDLAFRSLARELYDLLLRPARAQLTGIDTLIIVPDGPLWNLPFQALLGDDGHYLLEDFTLAYAPSISVLREMMLLRANRAANRNGASGFVLLAMGDPALDRETLAQAATAFRDEDLGPLPEAALELQALKKLYGAENTALYSGAQAREDLFKDEAGKFRILHLATHGILNDASPLYSNVLLSPTAGGKDDGMLEAWEIMRLELKADLAVLSACDTARGRISAGEGVIGMSWAFFAAGVPTTVVSQWKVESMSTAQLMLAFHRARKAAEENGTVFSTARALQLAEVELMHDPQFSHPFYWAGFIVVGDP